MMASNTKTRIKGAAMRLKAITVLVIAALSAALFVAVRSANRADAAGGNCYSDPAGPSTPQICN